MDLIPWLIRGRRAVRLDPFQGCYHHAADLQRAMAGYLGHVHAGPTRMSTRSWVVRKTNPTNYIDVGGTALG